LSKASSLSLILSLLCHLPPCSDDMPGLTVSSCFVYREIKKAIPYPRAAVSVDRPRSGAAVAPEVRHLFSTSHHPVLPFSSTPITTRRTGWNLPFIFESNRLVNESVAPFDGRAVEKIPLELRTPSRTEADQPRSNLACYRFQATNKQTNKQTNKTQPTCAKSSII